VSRVIPPTTTIKAIIAQQAKSHAATGPSLCVAATAVVTPECAVVAVEIDKARSSEMPDIGQSETAIPR
jgi:hypothetical protein